MNLPVNRWQFIANRSTTLGLVFAIALLGCSTPQRSAITLEEIDTNIVDVPKRTTAVRISETGISVDGKRLSYSKARRRLAVAEQQGGVVFCEIDKFVTFPEEQLRGLASSVIDSGGRFFYRQQGGAIDGLFICTELRAR